MPCILTLVQVGPLGVELEVFPHSMAELGLRLELLRDVRDEPVEAVGIRLRHSKIIELIVESCLLGDWL